MKNHLPKPAYKLAHGMRRASWQLFKPETHGVKGLILHPDDHNYFLVIRNSYGDTERYTLPGGRYFPTKSRLHVAETPEAAIRREVSEEVGLSLYDPITAIGGHESSVEGKRDHVIILGAVAVRPELTLSHEVNAARWASRQDYVTELVPSPISRFIELALATDWRP